MTHTLIALLVALGSAEADVRAPTPVGNRDAESAHALAADEAARPIISVRQTEPTTVVYSEYTGPYWGVGPVLRRVQADMTAGGVRGATFVRFPGDPRGGNIVPAATLVGYFAQPGARPKDAYVVKHWQPALVAVSTVRGPIAGTTALYPLIRTWATAHGYTVVGPIIEVYEPVPPGTSVDDQRTEIRMPVRPRPTPAVPPLQPDAPMPATPGAHVLEPGVTEPDPQNAVYPEPTDSALASDPVADGVIPDIVESPDRSTLESGVRPAVADARTFAALVDQGRYDEAMTAAWPQGTWFDGASLRWLHQINLRVRAIAAAFGAQDTEAARRIEALADALNAALLRVSEEANNPGGSLTGATGAAPVPPGGTDSQGIVQALDRLMAKVGQRSVNATHCLAELHRVLERIDKRVGDGKQE